MLCPPPPPHTPKKIDENVPYAYNNTNLIVRTYPLCRALKAQDKQYKLQIQYKIYKQYDKK